MEIGHLAPEKGFYHIWALQPSWSCDQEQIFFSPTHRGSIQNFALTSQAFFHRRSYLKIVGDDNDGRTTEHADL